MKDIQIKTIDTGEGEWRTPSVKDCLFIAQRRFAKWEWYYVTVMDLMLAGF